MLAPCPSSPNCVSTMAQEEKQWIAPISYQGERSQVLLKLKNIVSTIDRVKLVEETEDYLHYEFRSRIFRFVDDVEFFFPPEEKVIHMRSASRVGYSDFGVNRKRLVNIRKKFTDKTVKQE